MKLNLLLLESYFNMESLIAYAFSFSHRSGRNLKIAYVYDVEWVRMTYTAGTATMADPGLAEAQQDAVEDYEKAGSEIRTVVSEYLKTHSVDVPFEIVVTEENRLTFVQAEVDKHGSDVLLLIGNAEHYSENLGGDLTYPFMISQVKIPVFIIPESMNYAVLQNIVYLTDFHHEDMGALRNLAELFRLPGLKITILHNAADFTFEEKLKWIGFVELARQITEDDTMIPVLMREQKMKDALQSYLEQHEVDLIGILKEKKGFFKEIFSTSETRQVIKHFGKPVLIYHEN